MVRKQPQISNAESAAKQVGQAPSDRESGHTARRTRKGPVPILRRLAIFSLILLLTLFAGFLILTRGPLARRLVLNQITPRVNGQVDIGRASIGLDGTIHLRNLTLAAPGLHGPARRILIAPSATIRLRSLFSGSPTPASIDITDPILRVSQNADTGVLNVTAIGLNAAAGPTTTLPAINVTGGILELAEHSDDAYHILRRLSIAGSLSPTDQPDTYSFEIEQSEPEHEPFRLTGAIHPDRIEVNIDELDLAAWPNEAVPSRLRQLHQNLALKGRVLPTRLVIARDGSLDLSVDLQGVELNLPVEQAPVARGHMTDVHGSIRVSASGVQADLDGKLGGVPATATFHADRPDLASSFSCELHVGRVQLIDNLDRLGYIPEFVRDQLHIFSNPTAKVALDLKLARHEGADDVDVTGLIHVYDGVASYRDFPYEFTNLEGVFELQKDALIIRSVTGSAASGATLQATGRVSPLSVTAEATIDVTVTDVPLDGRLRAGLGIREGELYDTLLNRDQYQSLLDRGLIIHPRDQRAWLREQGELRSRLTDASPDDADRIEARLAKLDSLLQRPAFNLGGRSTVNIHIHRHEGSDDAWDREIAVHIPQGGFLPRHFPLPIIAKDVTLHVQNAQVSLEHGTFQGIDGGTATVEAIARLDDQSALPKVTVTATDVPVTPLLINAIPGRSETNSTQSAHALLDKLGLAGTLDCVARIGHPDLPIFDIEVRPRGVAAALEDWTTPQGEQVSGLSLQNLTGDIHAGPGLLTVDLNASITGPGQTGQPSVASLQAGVAYDLPPDLLDQPPDNHAPPPAIEVRTLRAHANHLDVALPIEQIVALVNESAAAQLHDLRQTYQPAGFIDATLTQGNDRGNAATQLTIEHAGSVRLTALGSEITIPQTTGRVVVTRGESIGLQLDHFGGQTLVNGDPFGSIELNGNVAPTDQGPAGTVAVTVTHGQYLHTLAPSLLGSSPMSTVLAQADPAATFDLNATIRVAPGSDPALDTLHVQPHTLAFTRQGRRIRFNDIQGSIDYAEGQAEIRDLQLLSDGWSAMIDGRVTPLPNSDFDADLAFSLDADSLTPDMHALLPADLDNLLRQLSIDVAGETRLEEGHLLYARRGNDDRVDVLGRVFANAVSANVGIPINDLNGYADFAAHTHPSLGSPQFEVQINASAFRAADIWMSDGTATIRSSADGQAIEIGPFAADAHGGRIAGSALVWNEPDSIGLRYDFKTMLSGVRFAPVLRDLALDTAPPDPDEQADESRGVIDGQITMYGLIDGPRRGAGQVQISEGRVLKLPLLVPIIEVGNLTLPRGELLDLARAQFYIQNQTATFEELSVLSKSIELIGYGTMNLDNQQLDLRVNSRSAHPIPLVSPVFQGIRDELITTRVRGTVRDPKLSTEQFTATRMAIGSLLGQAPSEQERLMRDIKHRAMQFRERSLSDNSEQISPNFDRQDNNQHP